MSDGKNIDGRNLLTDNIIDRMQNYFGQAIRNNSGEMEQMKKNIWAIFLITLIARLSIDFKRLF